LTHQIAAPTDAAGGCARAQTPEVPRSELADSSVALLEQLEFPPRAAAGGELEADGLPERQAMRGAGLELSENAREPRSELVARRREFGQARRYVAESPDRGEGAVGHRWRAVNRRRPG
jgi:hypothetical protein